MIPSMARQGSAGREPLYRPSLFVMPQEPDQSERGRSPPTRSVHPTDIPPPFVKILFTAAVRQGGTAQQGGCRSCSYLPDSLLTSSTAAVVRHRCQAAPGKVAPIASVRPRWASTGYHGHASQTAGSQVAEKAQPTGAILADGDVQAQDLPVPLRR
jgi:hypothetical protein